MSDDDADDIQSIDYKDPDDLERAYNDRKMTMPEIAEVAGVSATTISRWIDEHGIESRRPGPGNTEYDSRSESDIDHTDPEVLRELYHDRGLSVREIADLSAVRQQTVRHHLKKHDIERRDRVESSRWASRNEYAGLKRAGNGYIEWRDYWSGDRVSVHRLLAVAEYGFDAVCDKVVHHKNNIRWDNRPENIELMTPSEHAKHHTEAGDFAIGPNSE